MNMPQAMLLSDDTTIVGVFVGARCFSHPASLTFVLAMGWLGVICDHNTNEQTSQQRSTCCYDGCSAVMCCSVGSRQTGEGAEDLRY